MPDQIFIKNLAIDIIIGVNDGERHHKQKVVVNITMDTDIRPASRSDDIEDTVNYLTISEHIKTLAENSQFFLVESLAEAIADICLSDERVTSVKITVEKPEALRHAESAGVIVERTK